MEQNYAQFRRQFSTLSTPLICWSAARVEGEIAPEPCTYKWRSPLQPEPEEQVVEESVLHALSPYAADAAVLRAIGLGEQIGHYIIPEQYGKPRIFLLVRDPSALLERRGWLQLTEGHGFTHLNNDPVEFPCNFIYRGTGKFAVHAQTEVGIENLTRPLVEVPKRLAFHEVLMRVSSIREVDGSLLVRYLDGRPSENLPLFTP